MALSKNLPLAPFTSDRDVIAATALALVYAALRHDEHIFEEQLAELPADALPTLRAEWAAVAADLRARGLTRELGWALLDALGQDLQIPAPNYAAHGGIVAWRNRVRETYVAADYFAFPGLLRQPTVVLVTYVWAIETLGGGSELSTPPKN